MSSSLAAGGGDGAGRISQTKFGGAVATQPNDDLGSIGPEKRTYLSRHLHRMVHTQTLQCLNVEYAVVEFALSALIPVNTLSLTKHLSRHDESPLFSASRGSKTLSVGDELLKM